jgi:hypothetical protein
MVSPGVLQWFSPAASPGMSWSRGLPESMTSFLRKTAPLRVFIRIGMGLPARFD